MHIKSALSAILFIIIALFIYSCSEDNTTTNQPASDVLFTMDSLSVWLSGSVSGINSYTFQQTTTAGRVKVEYTVQTNADSVNSMAWVKDSSNGTPPHVVEQQYYWNVDSLVSYTMDIPAQPIHLRLETRLNVYGGSFPHYIRLKNIKVTKQ